VQNAEIGSETSRPAVAEVKARNRGVVGRVRNRYG